MVRAEEPICRHCQINASQMVDHIVALADGGTRLDRSNLQALCLRCHARKTAAEVRIRREG
jgi:5-methylcytosine-specific restriction protein A